MADQLLFPKSLFFHRAADLHSDDHGKLHAENVVQNSGDFLLVESTTWSPIFTGTGAAMAVKDPPSVYLTGTTEILTSGSGRQPAQNRDSRHIQPTPIAVTIYDCFSRRVAAQPALHRKCMYSTQDFYVSLLKMYGETCKQRIYRPKNTCAPCNMKQRSECIGIHVPLIETRLMYTSFDMYVWYQHI